uniref:MABP1/WDR62 second WD40 domain-containing protein n=1 Tax=Acrobeloides nanus TaxID=290746 RepID=A0A914C1N5_9BILA
MAKLERVLGCTACSSSISVDQSSGLVAYPAGSTVVVVNPKTQNQVHLVSSSKNHITCLAFSFNGRYIATGEFGQDPRVRVWEFTRDGQFIGHQVAELKNHKLGITCLSFSRDTTQLISIGNQHDGTVVVWDWQNQRKIAENRLSAPVNAMDTSEDGRMFVTVGVRHVKFWYLEQASKSGSSPLQGRSAILADQRNNTFVDVCCASDKRTFAITVTKLLIEFHDKKLVNTYEMQGEIPYSLTMGDRFLYIGFGNGAIRAMDVDTMDVKLSLVKPHCLRFDIASQPLSSSNTPAPQSAKYPDVHSLAYHEKSNTLTVMYSDRSIYHWQIFNDGKIVKLSSQLFHVGAIFDLEVIPVSTSWLPAGTFITAGADETIRFWNIEKCVDSPTGIFPPNKFSNELRKILYLGEGANSLCEQPDKNFGGILADTLESTTGIRCLKLSSDGKHLAAGGRDGNISIFDVTTLECQKIAEFEAHDQEILVLEYTDSSHGGRRLFASGSRDRLIHLYDAENDYSHLETIDDHTSSINSIKFCPSADGFEMLTCATDKLVVIRHVHCPPSDSSFQLERVNQIASQFGLNYLTVSPEGLLIAACQDRQLRTYTISGKLARTVKGTLCEEGTLTKLCMDPSGTFAATVCSDRYVYVVDIATGECAAVLSGQSDCVTSIGFSPDCRRLIVVSHSGCVFVWRLSNMLTKRMTTKLAKMSANDAISERCTTPDSLIESGSDSASVIGTKKDPRGIPVASGSEFGSLTSVQIAHEDDLDSGVGGHRQPPAVFIDANDSEDQRAFEVKRVPAEVIRRSSGSLLNVSGSNWELSNSPEDDLSTEAGTSAMLTSSPGNYTSSRSMSNLHRANVSPQRPRRKWGAPQQDNGYSFPTPMTNGDKPDMHSMNSMSSRPVANQPQHIYHSPAKNLNPGMSASISLNAIRNVFEEPSYTAHVYNLPQQHKDQFSSNQPPTPPSRTATTFGTIPHRTNTIPVSMTNPAAARAIEESFERTSGNRNSLTKRYLSHLGSNGNSEPRTVWTPEQVTKRRSSNLFGATPTPSIQRRQSEIYANSAKSAETTPNQNGSSSQSNASGGAPIPQPRTRLLHKLKQRRMTVSSIETAPVNGHASFSAQNQNRPTTTDDDYTQSELHLRSRSQSPSQLALHLAAAARESAGSTSTLTRPRDNSDAGTHLSRLTPSSSRTNLRSISANLNQSSNALNRLQEARDRLKKSQENLAVAIGDDGIEQSSSTSMSRSRSIGNLRFTTARPQDAHNATFGGLSALDRSEASPLNDSKRHIARSVTSLHNGSDATDGHHPDDITLRAQYGIQNRTTPSRFSQVLKDLKKNSNPDLTNDGLFEGSDANGQQFDDPNSPYYSTTLPKSMRKGAVQKRVERSQPKYRARLEQTTDSDSNASDATNTSPLASSNNSSSSYLKQGSPFLKNSTPTTTTTRSVSSVEPVVGPRMNRRYVDTPNVTLRKTPNYLAQKLGGPDTGAPDMSNEDGSPTSSIISSIDSATISHQEFSTPHSKTGLSKDQASCSMGLLCMAVS